MLIKFKMFGAPPSQVEKNNIMLSTISLLDAGWLYSGVKHHKSAGTGHWSSAYGSLVLRAIGPWIMGPKGHWSHGTLVVRVISVLCDATWSERLQCCLTGCYMHGLTG